MLYVLFSNQAAAQDFIASINLAMGFPTSDDKTTTWAQPLPLATPAGSYVVPVDPAQTPSRFLNGAVAFPTDGSWAWLASPTV